MERSLVIIKPDAMHTGLGGAIISRLEAKGLRVAGIKLVHMDRVMAGRHYGMHRGKAFFEELMDFITSAPIMAIVFDGENAVQVIREAMGATDPAKAAKGTMRADFGTDATRNAIHGSDSVDAAEEEIRLFFRENELFPRKK
ncbi:MAG: nucleoside-diphosphate kinase [Chloroflexota bacterium]